jgi:hypothetical protein
MSFKIQVKISTSNLYNNSSQNFEWHDVHPTGFPPYEYDTYELADNMIDIIKHENWDRDKYRVKEILIRKEITIEFCENEYSVPIRTEGTFTPCFYDELEDAKQCARDEYGDDVIINVEVLED